MERHGRFMVTQNTSTPGQQAELIQRLAEAHKELPSQIAAKVAKLEELLSLFDPLDVIANLMVINTFHPADSYKEYEMEGNVAYVEYVALLCLKRRRWTSKVRLLGNNELEPIDNLIKEIFQDTQFYYVTEMADANHDNPADIVEKMRFLTITNELIVRFPGYSHHLEDALRRILAPSDRWLADNLGFSSDDALKAVGAIESLLVGRFDERRGAARDERKSLRKEVRDYRRGRLEESRFPRQMVEDLAALPEKEMLRETQSLAGSWLFFALGDTFSFTPQDVADMANVTKEAAQSFLNMFSLRFGDVGTEFSMPSPAHPLQTKPLIKDDDGRFLCPSPQSLMWALRPALEEALNPASPACVNKKQSVWQKYTKSRAAVLESEVTRLISAALPHAQVYGNLKHNTPDRPDAEFELDALVLFDRVLMLFEAKAGSVKPAARRGGQKSMVQSLKDLVVDAHNQGLRASSYIDAVDQPLFRTAEGQELRLDKNSFDQRFIITVSLDEVSVFSPILHEVAELGIFSSSELPWAVPYFDFRVICELIEFPSQFVHFLRRRKRLGELAFVSAHDELDYFGHYLAEGLFFEDLRDSGFAEMQLLSYTGQFDDHYFTEMGLRSKPAAKPRQQMPKQLRALIQELEDMRPENYVSVVCALLDMDSKGRGSFFRFLNRATRAARKDRKAHDFSFTYDYGGQTRGITVFCGASARPEILHERLATYCAAKKYQQKCDSWIGLGRLVDLPRTFHMHVAMEGPWEYDEALERLAATLPSESTQVRLRPPPRGARADEA